MKGPVRPDELARLAARAQMGAQDQLACQLYLLAGALWSGPDGYASASGRSALTRGMRLARKALIDDEDSARNTETTT